MANRRFFEPVEVQKGAYRSAEVRARCKHCEEPAVAYCAYCGQTLCQAHAPEDGLCPQCERAFSRDLNQKQGRLSEGALVMLLSFAIMALGGLIAAGLFFIDFIGTKIAAWIVGLAAALAPVWVLLGRAWWVRRRYRRIR